MTPILRNSPGLPGEHNVTASQIVRSAAVLRLENLGVRHPEVRKSTETCRMKAGVCIRFAPASRRVANNNLCYTLGGEDSFSSDPLFNSAAQGTERGLNQRKGRMHVLANRPGMMENKRTMINQPKFLVNISI